jgi:flagellar hook-length control protein FliK
MIADRCVRSMEGPRFERGLPRANDAERALASPRQGSETRERPLASAFGETIAKASRAAERHSAQRALSAGQSRTHSGAAQGERDRTNDREARAHNSEPQARGRESGAHADEVRARNDESRRRDKQPRTNGDESRAGSEEARARGRRALATDESARAEERHDGNPRVAPAPPAADPPAPQGLPGGIGLACGAATSQGEDTSDGADGDLAQLPGAAGGDPSAAAGSRLAGTGAKPMAAGSRDAPLQFADVADAKLQPDALKSEAGADPGVAASETPSASNRALSEFSARLAEIGAAGGSGGHGIAGLSSGAASAMPAPAQPIHVGAIATQVGDPGFPGQVAGAATSLVIAGIENAEITVQPPEHGPVKIEISLNGESASIAFSAVQPDTRQAIEQSLPVLKDMLAEHGLLLSNASVGDGRAGAGDGRPGQGPGSPANSSPGLPEGRRAGSGSGGDAFGDPRRPNANRRGLLDLYA